MRTARVVALAAALGYAGLALASGADRAAATNAARAERLPRALAAQSLAVAGDRALADGRRDDAMGIAQAAVARTPVEPTSTALLGAARLARGDADGAREAFTVAGKLGWRVPLTQIYWMREALDAGDPRIAALRLDALFRQQPALLAQDELLAPLESTPDGRAALAGRLALRPGWLEYYANGYGSEGRDAMLRRAAVLALLPGQGMRLACDGIAPASRRLVVLGEAGIAQRLWRVHCDAPMPPA